MKIVTAPEIYETKPTEVSVFLAGGITDCPDWQKTVIDALRSTPDLEWLVIYNPRRENFPINDPNAAREQIEWEFNALEKADIFSIFFSGGESLQPICMYELGRNLHRMKTKYEGNWYELASRIVVTVEPECKRRSDVIIQTELAMDGYKGFAIYGNALWHASYIASAAKQVYHNKR